jgi:hypothetical protein
VSAIDFESGMIWIADAHRGDGKRFILHADDKVTAFLKLESATRANCLDRLAKLFQNSALDGLNQDG